MSIKNDRWSALSLKDRADLMNMYITNGISDLKEMKKHYNGNPYRDLNTSDYDYFNASPEMAPTEESQHWDSRNPHTGRLLKGENHPTFDLMIDGENKAGYKIVRGYNNELYSIPNTPDNYVKNYNSFSGEEDHPAAVRQGLQNGTIKAVKKEDGTYVYIRTVPEHKGFFEKIRMPNYKTEDLDKKLAELYTRVSGGWDGSLLSLRRHGIPGLIELYKRKQLADFSPLNNIKEEAFDITNNQDYTGVVTTNNRGFKTVAFGSKAVQNELGYNPDFVTSLFEDVVPEGVIVKENNSKGGSDHRGESHLVRTMQQKHIDKYGEPYRIFQLNDEVLDKNTVNYLDSLVNVGDNNLKLETVNTSLPFDSVIRIDDGGNPYSVEYAYDGQKLTKVTAKDKNGNEAVKYIDIFDANPENKGIKVNWITKPILNLFEEHSKPYIVTTPWIPEK